MALQSIGVSDMAGGIDADYTRDSTRALLALFDPNDDENAVLAGCGITIGSAHPTSNFQRCLGLRVAHQYRTTNPTTNADARLWKIDVSYGLWNILERSPDGNPVNIPKRFRLDFTSNSVPAFTDVDGNPIVNAAGDYYDPPVESERLHATLTVLRNEASPNVNSLALLANAVNKNTWNGFPPKTVRMMPPKIPMIAYSQATNTFYWPMEYLFEINFDTWVKQVLNQGFRELDADGNLVPIFLNGQPVSDPVMLDEAGKAILKPEFVDSSGDTPGDGDSDGSSGETPGGGEPPEGGTGTASGEGVVINAYDIYRTFDFSDTSSGLNMDNLFTLPSLGS